MTEIDHDNLLHRLLTEMYRVAHEAREAERDTRGMLTLKSGFENIDIYAHPESIMHLRRDCLPQFWGQEWEMRDPKKMPPNAVGKVRDCWLFSDDEQPRGALIIRLNGRVYSDVPIVPLKTSQDDTK